MPVKEPHQKPRITPQRRVELHLNLYLLPVLVGILGIVYVVTGFKGWLIFFVGTGGAWLLSWLWVWSLRRNLRVERSVHMAWATVGESVPEQVRLVNHGWLPAVWVEITDESETLETPLRMVSDVGLHTTHTRNLSHLFKKRGLYTLGPTHIRSGDPFGIYTLSTVDRHASTILVTPPILPLPLLNIPSAGWTGDERLRQGFISRNISEAGLRNYVPGDSLRRIHWRASAHFDTLIVRQQESATSRDWCIFLDLDRDSQAGTGDHSTLELSIVLAASLAVRGLREYRRVGLVLAGPKYISLEPSADLSQAWRILRALAMAEAGDYSLASLVRHSRPTQAATAILITPSTTPAWVAIAGRQFQGQNLYAMLVDPHDFGSSKKLDQVILNLAHSRVPYSQMPGSLLDQAYSSAQHGQARRMSGGETLKRYFQQGRQAWQSID